MYEYKSKVSCIIGVFLVASLVAANQSQCEDCIADSLLNAINEFDVVRHCFLQKHSDVLIKEKVYTIEALVDVMAVAINVNNNLVEEKCRTLVEREMCDAGSLIDITDCQMHSLRMLTKALGLQEQCHGQAFKTEEMRVAARLVDGNIYGWKGIHPDC